MCCFKFVSVIQNVRQPGIEPGSIAWKATMLTFTPPTLCVGLNFRRSDERRVKHYKPGSNPWWRTVLFVKDYKTCGAHNFADIQYLYILRGVLSRNCVLRHLAKKSTLGGIEPGQGYWQSRVLTTRPRALLAKGESLSAIENRGLALTGIMVSPISQER